MAGECALLSAHLREAGVPDTQAQAYARSLVQEGCDTLEAFSTLEYQELIDDYGFRKFHARSVDKHRKSKGGANQGEPPSSDGGGGEPAVEASPAPQDSSALLQHLWSLKVSSLKKAARKTPAIEAAHLDAADDADDPKRAVIELLVQHTVGNPLASMHAQLAPLKPSELKRHARAASIAPKKIDLADDANDPRAELVKLLLEQAAEAEAEAPAVTNLHTAGSAGLPLPELVSEGVPPSQTSSSPPSQATTPSPRKFVQRASPEDSSFGSMRFDGVVPAHAKQLKSGLLDRGKSLEIIDMKGGGDIDRAVIDGIEHCQTFIVFGSKKYGEDTSNAACTYYESKFAQSKHKKIILIRMIPFDEDFEFPQARFMFGLNKLELPWMLGTPMPAELPDQIVAAMEATEAEGGAAAAVAAALTPRPRTHSIVTSGVGARAAGDGAAATAARGGATAAEQPAVDTLDKLARDRGIQTAEIGDLATAELEALMDQRGGLSAVERQNLVSEHARVRKLREEAEQQKQPEVNEATEEAKAAKAERTDGNEHEKDDADDAKEATPKVALLAADFKDHMADIHHHLSRGLGTPVALHDVTQATPTLAALRAYEVVAVVSATWARGMDPERSTTFDNAAVGDVLADYVDGGGSVMIMYTNGPPTGRWERGQYSPCSHTGVRESKKGQRASFELLEGVRPVVGPLWYNSGQLHSHAQLVSRWGSGSGASPFIALGRPGPCETSLTMLLNFYPPSNACTAHGVQDRLWDRAKMDGGEVMAAAVRFCVAMTRKLVRDAAAAAAVAARQTARAHVAVWLQAANLLQSAISRVGVDTFNSGRTEQCYGCYHDCCVHILAQIPPQWQSASEPAQLLQHALAQAAAEDGSSTSAWTMRHAIDSVIELAHDLLESTDVSLTRADLGEFDARALSAAIRAAISDGVPLWNSGDYAACAARYMQTGREYAKVEPRLATALQKANGAPSGSSRNAKGWIMRHAFDSILAHPGSVPQRVKAAARQDGELDAGSKLWVAGHGVCTYAGFKRSARGASTHVLRPSGGGAAAASTALHLSGKGAPEWLALLPLHVPPGA